MCYFSGKPRHLPISTGPYMPGCTDVMLDYAQDGIFMRFFYPTEAKKDSNNYTKWAKWMPDDSYIVGLARVFMIFPFLIRFIFWWSDINLFPSLYGEKPKLDKKLRPIIISHGLGAHRNFYSNLCCELASRGFLIVALEHRDNSAGNTYYYSSKINAGKDVKTLIDHKPIPLGKNHYRKRNEQVHKRAKECSRALDVLISLHAGEKLYNVLDDTLLHKNIAFSLDLFGDKLDLNSVTMMGHSFGGASALLALSQRKELRQGILLDPWMFSIKDENLYEKIEQPLRFLNTQTFHLKSNVNIMEKFLDREHRDMCTILHTTHEHQTDTPLLIGSWLNWFMKKLNPEVALKINTALVVKFLHEQVEYPENIEEFDKILKDNSRNIEYGLTKPWA
ncbi:unnamed protein product [Brassicogethes aeneus]|uniref:1-alkyl-2-acetylglycerophosphocholine esterase n=1 Tax=Brassicogethes aeneus TaxID=1431903 RepID=A0A9P0FNA5_BRAAE|nr:unnamed protein product [Brassicogethes aeneus]